MKTIGELVQDSVDTYERGLLEWSFVPACTAVTQTAQKAFDQGLLSAADYQTYIRDDWNLISFVGIPEPGPMPADLPFRLRRAVPSFNVPDVLKEIFLFAVRQTIATKRLPIEIAFNKIGGVEVIEDRLMLPKSLIFGLLCSVIFHPVNKDEQIANKYWINVWDFKMFVSELWGRKDIAERIMFLYQN